MKLELNCPEKKESKESVEHTILGPRGAAVGAEKPALQVTKQVSAKDFEFNYGRTLLTTHLYNEKDEFLHMMKDHERSEGMKFVEQLALAQAESEERLRKLKQELKDLDASEKAKKATMKG